MDNEQIPPVQPIRSAMPGDSQVVANGVPAMIQRASAPVVAKKDIGGLIKTIVIIAVSLIAMTFIGLFIWKQIEYIEVRTDVDGQIRDAVTAAEDKKAIEMEKEFSEREKYPYNTFSGPVDYGQLTFEYPKTWSVYVAADAATGGDFDAYFNPIQVDAVGKDTINALRLTIRDKNFDEVVSEYQKVMDKKDSGLMVQSVTFGKDNNITGNRYAGKIPNTSLNGYIVIFKIRDKTAILQTDSVLFQEDFDKLLNTITFNA